MDGGQYRDPSPSSRFYSFLARLLPSKTHLQSTLTQCSRAKLKILVLVLALVLAGIASGPLRFIAFLLLERYLIIIIIIVIFFIGRQTKAQAKTVARTLSTNSLSLVLLLFAGRLKHSDIPPPLLLLFKSRQVCYGHHTHIQNIHFCLQNRMLLLDARNS